MLSRWYRAIPPGQVAIVVVLMIVVAGLAGAQSGQAGSAVTMVATIATLTHVWLVRPFDGGAVLILVAAAALGPVCGLTVSYLTGQMHPILTIWLILLGIVLSYVLVQRTFGHRARIPLILTLAAMMGGAIAGAAIHTLAVAPLAITGAAVTVRVIARRRARTHRVVDPEGVRLTDEALTAGTGTGTGPDDGAHGVTVKDANARTFIAEHVAIRPNGVFVISSLDLFGQAIDVTRTSIDADGRSLRSEVTTLLAATRAVEARLRLHQYSATPVLVIHRSRLSPDVTTMASGLRLVTTRGLTAVLDGEQEARLPQNVLAYLARATRRLHGTRL